MKYKKILKTSRRGENIYSASTINADTIFKSPISLSLEYLASKAFEANSFQRWNRELTSALQFFWVNKLTSSGKHSKLPSLRSTIFMGLKNSRSFDKVAFCFARKLLPQKLCKLCLSKQLSYYGRLEIQDEF